MDRGKKGKGDGPSPSKLRRLEVGTPSVRKKLLRELKRINIVIRKDMFEKSIKMRMFRDERFEGDEENVETFNMDLFMSEVNGMSAIESYFMKGKTATKNKNRRKRGKKNKRGEEREEKKEEERESSEGEEAREEGGEWTECRLGVLKEYCMKRGEEAEEIVEREHGRFSRWNLLIAARFNVLVHGLGSLRDVLRAYAERMRKEYTVAEVEAFRSDFTMRALLSQLHDIFTSKVSKHRGLSEWARQLSSSITSHLIIIIHNIDAITDPVSMEALQCLSSSSTVHIIASCQHINRMMLWNLRSLSSFRWVHDEMSTWMPGCEEAFSGSSSLLGLSSTSSLANHSLESLQVLWTSLNKNARNIFRTLFSLSFGSKEEGEKKSVPFWRLFHISRDNLWISSDAALTQQLVEFADHQLIRSRRGQDGNELLIPSVEKSVIFRFLKSVGEPLEDIEEEEDE